MVFSREMYTSTHFRSRRHWRMIWTIIILYNDWPDIVHILDDFAPLFRESDVLIGALDENLLSNQHFIATTSYYQDELTWCVQKSRPIPIWINFFRMTNSPPVWIVLIIICFFAIYFVHFMEALESDKPKWDWMRIAFAAIRISCCLVSEYKPKTLPTRINFIAWLFGSMIFYTSFISIWTKFMTSFIFEHQVESIREILNYNFELVGDEFSFNHIMRQNQVNALI